MRNILKQHSRILIAGLLLTLILLVWWGNTALEVNEYTVASEKIPAAFSGFRIAQVSDLHNAEFGKENSWLVALLEQTEPDMIVLTGDLVDSRNTDIDVGIAFARAAVEIAPVFYVTGNHEARILEYEALKAGLEAAGVMVLSNEIVRVDLAGDYIYLAGIDDPSFQTDYLFGDAASVVDAALTTLLPEDGYTILLAHRPELFETYVSSGVDLVFSGHAHGGQFRLPFVGGLFAPNQGFLPRYDAGCFISGDTTMFVSRGVGNSLVPIRLNNPPEILVVELEHG